MDNQGKQTGYRVEVIARLFDVSVRRIQQLTQEGVLETIQTPDGRRYELIPTVQRYVKYLSDKAYGRSASAKEADLKAKKLEAEIALKESQAELHQLKTDIAAGRYIKVEDVIDDYRVFFAVFKRFALNLPGRLVDEVGDRIDPMDARRLKKALRKEAARLMESFAVAGKTEQELTKEPKKPAAASEPEPAREPQPDQADTGAETP